MPGMRGEGGGGNGGIGDWGGNGGAAGGQGGGVGGVGGVGGDGGVGTGGGGGDGDGVDGGAVGGDGGGAKRRGPQSSQSRPASHSAEAEAGPPSSHTLLLACAARAVLLSDVDLQWLKHTIGGGAAGGGMGGDGGGRGRPQAARKARSQVGLRGKVQVVLFKQQELQQYSNVPVGTPLVFEQLNAEIDEQGRAKHAS